jgi:hypothetical protein
MGRVESLPYRCDLQYQQPSNEKARTSDDIIRQRAPCMFDSGSKISFDPVSEEAKESPTPKEDGVSQCSSGRGRRMSQQMVLSPPSEEKQLTILAFAVGADGK